MNDDPGKALRASREIITRDRGMLTAKTTGMNRLLSEEIPQFRCSDPKFEEIYYYLWALYLMYYIDSKKGGDGKPYPNCGEQLSRHPSLRRLFPNQGRLLGTRQAALRLWKRVLTWKHLVVNGRYRETPNGTIMLSDNKGTTWHSGAYGVSCPNMSLAHGKFTNIRAI